jgi:hypothetical protein
MGRAVYNPLFSNYVRASVFIDPTFAVSSRPGALSGYFKGTSAGGDTLAIAVSMFKDGIMIGFGFYFTTQTVLNWTSFTNPITYVTEETPDEGFVAIYAGQAFSSNDGTDYFVDNLSFSGTAGISNKLVKSNFTLFPNPAKDELNIGFTLANSDNFEFELINLQGVSIPVSEKVAFHAGTSTYQISISSIPSGLYFLKANGDNSQFIEKIIIKHE